jgi:hypothetical protein
MYGNRLAILFETRNRAKGFVAPLLSALVLALQFSSFVLSAHGQTGSPEPQRQVLGSLYTEGEVYVNDSRAPSGLSIFPGDVLRTSQTGSAILTTSGKGSLQISSLTQIIFSGDPRFVAELKMGSISVKSVGGAGRAVVRAGNFVVVPTNPDEQASATIETMADGSFFITCSAGNVGVIPLQGAPGLFLQAGQSGRISPNSDLVALERPAPTLNQPAGKKRFPWIYLVLAGGGAAAAAGLAISHGGTPPPVSPSSP